MNNNQNMWYWLLSGACAIVVVCLGLVLLTGIGESSGATISAPSVVSQEGSYGSDGTYYPNVPNVQEKLAHALSENKDVKGWLMIPNTTVNEPVVQTDNNEYYLRRDYTGKYDFAGCYYIDYECTLGDDGEALSQNTIIYGHNLGSPQGVKDNPNAGKFAQLLLLEQESVAKQTPYVYFVTPAKTYVFEIFAVFYTEAVMSPVPFHYSSYTEKDFSALVKDAKERSEYSYDVDVKPEDRILTLSTCTYKYGTYSDNPNQRFVVMARCKTESEVFSPVAQIEKNPNPKAPLFS